MDDTIVPNESADQSKKTTSITPKTIKKISLFIKNEQLK